MKKEKPGLVIDEPVASGALRLELYGAREPAMALVGLARKQLGALRTYYGVNARLAAGEPGGYYSRRITLEDGSEIEAVTNDGLDTLRIYASAPQPPSPAPPQYPEPMEPPPVDIPQPYPYLWVGLRRLSGGGTCGDDNEETATLVRPHLFVWEPEQSAPAPGEDSMIVSDRGSELDAESFTPDIYPLRQTLHLNVPDPADPGHTVRLNYSPNGLYLVKRELAYDPQDDKAKWDQVAVLDPYEGEGSFNDNLTGLSLDNPDTDPRGLWTLPGKTQPGITGTPLGGDYVVGVVVEGYPCDAPDPVELLLEVRCGKPPNQSVEQYRITVSNVGFYRRELLPYGFGIGFPGDSNGPNPHGPCWWGFVSASLYGGQALVEDLPRGFDPDAGQPSREGLCGTRLAAQTTFWLEERGDPFVFQTIERRMHYGVQVFGYPSPLPDPDLAGNTTFPGPCGNVALPGTVITGRYDSGGHGEASWPAVSTTRPPGQPFPTATARPGYLVVKVTDWHRAFDDAGQPIDNDAAYEAELAPYSFRGGLLWFNWWWDEAGFHTNPTDAPH